MKDRSDSVIMTGTVSNDCSPLLIALRGAAKEYLAVQELIDDGAQVPLQRVTAVHSELVRMLANTQAYDQ